MNFLPFIKMLRFLTFFVQVIQQHVFTSSFGDDMKKSPTQNIHLLPGLVMCIEIKSYVAHIFYGWTMSHNTEITYLYNNRNYF